MRLTWVVDLSPTAYEFLTWCADDFTEAFALRDVLRRRLGDLTAENERDAALGVLRELLEAGLIRVGDMRDDTPGLAYRTGGVASIEARIAKDWDPANPPGMGEPPWFSATEAGRQIAARD